MPSRPGFYFFPADWRSDAGLRVSSEGARYLWFEMLGCMCEATRYGHMLVGGRKPTPAEIALATNTDPSLVEARLAELERNRVFSRTRKGVIYSRRMVRDNRRQQAAQKNGKLGGNPTLRKPKGNAKSDNPPDNPITLPNLTYPNQEESESLPTVVVSPPPARGDDDEDQARIDELVGELFERVGTTAITRRKIERDVADWVRSLGAREAATLIARALRVAHSNPFTLASMMASEWQARLTVGKYAATAPPPEAVDPCLEGIRRNREMDERNDDQPPGDRGLPAPGAFGRH